MKTLFAATFIGLIALTATAATVERTTGSPAQISDATVNAKIDARQNALMRVLLTSKVQARAARATR